MHVDVEVIELVLHVPDFEVLLSQVGMSLEEAAHVLVGVVVDVAVAVAAEAGAVVLFVVAGDALSADQIADVAVVLIVVYALVLVVVVVVGAAVAIVG